MTESPLQRLNILKLKSVKSRIESLTYKAPKFGAAVGEVISGSLGRGEGGKFANIEDIKRASMSNDPLSVFQGSQRRMFQTFYNAFTRDSPFKQDLDASQKKVADLLAASGGNYTDEVKAAQAASDELWRLDGAYRRNMMTGDTGLKPSGVSVKIEGFNSDKTGAGQSVADIMKAAGKDPEGMAKGIGERLIQDAYNYMSVFNQRDELKKLNNASPEFNLTTLPEGQKYRIDEEALKNGKLKVDFAYSADQPDGPSKDDITAAMSDIMMKLDPNIEQYAASFAQANPNFKIGKDGMVKDVLQQAMASLNDDPQKMALENPDLFKFALSAAQGVNLFEGEAGGQAVPTPSVEPKPTGETPPAPTPGPTPAPTPGPTPAPAPTPIDPSKYPGNDVEAGLEQDYVMPSFPSTPAKPRIAGIPGKPVPSGGVPEYINLPKGPMGNAPKPEEPSEWDRAFPPDTVFEPELVGKFNVYGKDRVLSAIAYGYEDEYFINPKNARNVRAMMNANLSDQRGAQVGASPAAQGPIEQAGGRGTVASSNTPSYIRQDPKALFDKYNKDPNFRRDFLAAPSYAQRKYNIPQDEFAAMVNDGVDSAGNNLFRDNSVMQNTQDWLYRNVAGGGSLTPEQMAENARQYGLNQKVDPNKPNPVDNKKPAYPKGPGVTQPQPNTGASSGGKFNVTGSANQPNLTIASVSSKLPKGTNPMYVASAIRSNPSLAAQYGLTSSEARMLMQYYAE